MKKNLLVLFSLIFTSIFAQEKPNIVWIVSEDNSPFIGCYGDTLAKTPNIDRLAEDGILFENAFANAPVCAPSRSTIITGMYPVTLGSQHMRSSVNVPKKVIFFPQYLRKAGYFTTLRIKRDYNIPKQDGTWDIDNFWFTKDALTGKKKGQPFFLFYNTWMTHESKLHSEGDKELVDYFKNTFKEKDNIDSLVNQFNDYDPENINIPPYQPDIPEIRDDWALYYKAIEMMDYEVGSILDFLKENNLIDNTIIIYSSDHGGVLGRSKRFDYESGLRVPMILWVPEKYKHLIKSFPSGYTDRIVSFVDMAPTILSIAGIKTPENMQGKAFAGEYAQKEDSISYGFRGRMDETYDMVRTIRTMKYRYIRNYMPYRPNGQHINYLWKAKSILAWEKYYKAGKCNDLQRAFFEDRPPEELYDITYDAGNVYNLAGNIKYEKILKELREINRIYVRKNFDTGFIPEGELWDKANKGVIPYKSIIDQNKDEWLAAVETADKATLNPQIKDIKQMLNSQYPSVRFWGASGCILLNNKAKELSPELTKLLNDPSGDVVANAAEALYLMGQKDKAINALLTVLSSNNVYIRLRVLNCIANRNISDKRILHKVKEMDTSNEYIKDICNYIINKN